MRMQVMNDVVRNGPRTRSTSFTMFACFLPKNLPRLARPPRRPPVRGEEGYSIRAARSRGLRCCAGSPVPSAPPRPGRPRAPPRLAPRWRGKLGRREASWWYVLGVDETSHCSLTNIQNARPHRQPLSDDEWAPAAVAARVALLTPPRAVRVSRGRAVGGRSRRPFSPAMTPASGSASPAPGSASPGENDLGLVCGETGDPSAWGWLASNTDALRRVDLKRRRDLKRRAASRRVLIPSRRANGRTPSTARPAPDALRPSPPFLPFLSCATKRSTGTLRTTTTS